MTPHTLYRAGATGVLGLALVLGGCVAPIGAMLQPMPGVARTIAGAPSDPAGCRQVAQPAVAGLATPLDSAQGLGRLVGAMGGAQDSGGTQPGEAAPCLSSKANAIPGAPAVPAQPAAAPQVAAPDLVRATQAQLIRLGYLHGGPDGVMGPMTSSAISRFEMASGLRVDGAPSAALLTRLQAAQS